MDSVQYIKNQIRYMCMAYKDRTGGSASEKQCQAYIAKELQGAADSIVTQDFTVHPDAGWAWIVVVTASCIASVLLPLLNVGSTVLAGIGLALSLLALAITIFHFMMGHPVLDRLFPAAEAKNVYATAKPRNEVRQRIVFCGHADAAYEMTYAHQGGAKQVLRVAFVALLGLTATTLLNTVLFIRHLFSGGLRVGGFWFWLRIASLLFIPAFLRAMLFFNIRCVVDGANDNLSGCAVAMATLKTLASPQARLEHTEVGCLITSSEACGLRGARAFGKQFASQDDGVETLFVVLDTLHNVDQLQLYTRGLNGFQQNSGKVAGLLYHSAKKLGHTLPEAEAYLGATDAEALSREGLEACALCGVDHMPQPYYHTRADTADNLSDECLAVCLNICLEAAREYDQAEVGSLLVEAV